MAARREEVVVLGNAGFSGGRRKRALWLLLILAVPLLTIEPRE